MSATHTLEPKSPAPTPRVTAPPSRAFVQRRASESAAPASAPESVHRTLSSPGHALDPNTRSFMESRFGHDFSQVRVHTDSHAADSARAINAHAYTSGNDIAFAPGKYQPDTSSGRHLLAHELAHTVQQRGLQRRASDLAVDTAPDSSLEYEAESAARSVSAGVPVSAISGRAPSSLISRDPGTKPSPGTAPADDAVDFETTPSGFSGALKYKVKPDGPIPKGTKPAVRKFRVDVFYMPGDKGEGAEAIYKQYASAKQLRAVVGFSDANTPRTELWEARNVTEDLGESWVQRVNWPLAEKDDRWKKITGQTNPFPKLTNQTGKTETAQIDHIVELQLGGANNPTNLRPLDATPNQASGRTIWQEVSSLAKAIRAYQDFALKEADQIELGFDSVQVDGNVWPGSPTTAPWNALKVHTKAMADRQARVADGTTKFIKLAAGANVEEFAVPATWGSAAKVADLSASDFNKSPAEMISSMSLKTITWVAPTIISVDAGFDLRNRTRIPLGANKEPDAAKAKFTMSGVLKNEQYDLKLLKSPQGLGFDYPYLSPLSITSFTLNPQGDLDWTGKLKSTVAILGTLDVSFVGGELKVTKGIDPATLKQKRILGIALNKADLTLVLSPEFKFEAGLGFLVGPEADPYLKGDITIRPVSGGLEGTGTIDFHIPKTEKAQSVLKYSHVNGVETWDAALTIESSKFSLPGGYQLSGKIDAGIESTTKALTFSGEMTVTLPGGTTGKFGLIKTKEGEFILTGLCTFKPPKFDKEVTVKAFYVLSSGALEATVETEQEFTLPVAKIKGSIKKATIRISPEGKVSVAGEAGVAFDKGRVKGSVTGKLSFGGFFSGTGSITVKLTDTLSVTATATYDETKKKEEQLVITGEIKIDNYKFFNERGGEKKLFSAQATIPVPGLSAGTSGLVLNIGGGAKLTWKFGPGLMSIKATATFNPLADNPDISLAFSGSASIGAEIAAVANIYAEAALQGDAIVAKAGIAAGLEATGTAALKAKGSATISGTYGRPNPSAEPRFDSAVILAFSAGLFLNLRLDAYVRAYAESIIGWNKSEKWVWNLAEKDFDTGLKFSAAAPFKYSSVDGLVLPEAKDVTYDEPNVDTEAMMKKRFNGDPSEKQPVT